MTRCVGKLAISSIFGVFVACLAAPPGAVGARRFEDGCQRIRMDGVRLEAPIEEIGDIDAWRPEASMPGCNVGCLAGWMACLAGCCWLAAAGWLTEIRKLAWK